MLHTTTIFDAILLFFLRYIVRHILERRTKYGSSFPPCALRVLLARQPLCLAQNTWRQDLGASLRVLIPKAVE